MQIYDRQKGGYTEISQYGQGKLEFLYGNALGRILLKLVISPVTSRFYGWLNRRRSSAKKIPGFIEEYGIDMNDYEERNYLSFSDFFTRRLKPGARTVDDDPASFVSPCDSKVLVYRIGGDQKMMIKGSEYTVDELVAGRTDTALYSGGYAFVFRLTMDDYHRYCYIDNGIKVNSYFVRGKLHTVSSISRDYKIYKENSRNISVLSTEHYGEIIQIEVGALLVGRITDHGKDRFIRGEEKGYFEPGGSTVIILVRPDTIVPDSDIIYHSGKGIETRVRYGEKIGKRI